MGIQAKGTTGQVSFEFMLVISLLAVILAIFFLILNGQSMLFFAQRSTLSASRNANAMASVLNYVYLAGDGVRYNFTVSRIGNNESLNISAFSIESRSPTTTAAAPLLTKNINATSVPRGEVMISNRNGGLYVG